MASLIDRDWLQPNGDRDRPHVRRRRGRRPGARSERYDALILREHPVSPDPDEAARLLADAWLSRTPRDEDEQLLRRVRFAGHELDVGVRGARCR